MRWWQVTLCGAVTTVVELATGSRPLLVATLALVALLAIGLLYRQMLASAVTGTSSNPDMVVGWGGTYHHRIQLRNAALLPIFGMRVSLKTSPPLGAYGFVASLAPRTERASDKVDVPCRTRGRYQVGPIVTHMSDPMGLFSVEQMIGDVTDVLVLPRYVPLRDLVWALDGGMPGESRGRRLGDSPEVAELRDYVVGDSLAAIHWPTTARMGHPVTKVFEPEAQTVFWLALDLDGSLPPECEELLVTAAASLGLHALRRPRVRVGVIASGKRPVMLQAQHGRSQGSRLLEALAVVRAGGATPLNLSDRRIGPGHVVALLTGRGPDAWGDRLRQLQRRGVVPHVITTHDSGHRWGKSSIYLPAELNDPLKARQLARALEGA